jgi:hypothetical protein
MEADRVVGVMPCELFGNEHHSLNMKQNYLRFYALLMVVGIAGITHTQGWESGVFAALVLSSAFAQVVKGNSLVLGVVPFEIQSSSNGDTLAAMDPEGVRQLWQEGADIFEQTADFWTKLEGGKDAIVETVTDLSKGVGQKIGFTTRSGFYDEPHMGEELFEEKEDFEERLINTDTLTVDFIRHATRSTQRMEEVMGMRGEIRSHDNEDLGDWMGRWKSEALFMSCINKVPSTNIVFANNKSFATLNSDDVVDWDEIVSLGAQMERMGGLPAMTGRATNGNPIYRNAFVSTGDGLLGLEQDPSFKLAIQNTHNEASAKMYFDGGYTDVRGHVITKYQPIDHDGEGAIGSPLNPKAVLGVAIATGTVGFDIKGGGNPVSAAKTKKLYFKFFPGHAYRFSYTDTFAPATEDRYVVIINPPNAPVDPNRFGFYKYTTGNNGNLITVTQRLAGTASGAAATTVGTVAWNAGKNTTVHPEGALILPATANGTVYGRSLMLGRRALRRGYGMYRNKRSQETHNGDFVTDRFITTVIGQAPRRDRLGRVPGVYVLVHAVPYAGIPTPDTGA